MTNDSTERPLDTERPLERRLLLRGGAVLAGAAGVTVIGAALGSPRAEATNGDAVTAGQTTTADATTSLTIESVEDPGDPALSLTNAKGPSLRLTPVGSDYDGGLNPGEFAFTESGPDVGLTEGLTSTVTTFLATGLDLDQIPFALAIPPVRLLDTRTEAGRDSIRTTSPNAFDSSHRLKAGSWMDVAVFSTDYSGLEAVFVNVVAVKPVLGGFLTVYPPGDRPDTSTLNFAADHNAANGAFILCGVADEDKDWYVVRVYSSATAHVVVDWTGATVYGISGAGESKRGSVRQRNAVKTNRMKRVLR